MSEPNCPQCQENATYADGELWICPLCGHEWSKLSAATGKEQTEMEADSSVRDANGNILADGDNVTVIKDLKVRGASGPIKAGTKVRGIRLAPDGPDGHNVSCKVDGFGSLHLKSEFLKKA